MMSDPLPKDADSLAALRREIDAVDAEMHRLLMRRGEVIERLISAKRADAAGSAFRPDREADMLTRLAARHRGRLPLATVEHIWREIIGTFTQLQSPFRVHAVGGGTAATRDLLRFHFGFATPLVDQPSPTAVISAIRDGATDLGVVALDGGAASAWWRELDAGSGAVKAIAILPFLSRIGEWPRCLVLGPAAIANPAADVTVCAATRTGAPVAAEAGGDFEILSACGDDLLLACRGDAAVARAKALATAEFRVVGSYCTPPADVSEKR